MTLAIFDLDNTLIGGDSDHLWGCFASEQGLVDSSSFAQQNDRFYRDYQSGELDIDAYLRFALSPLRGRSVAEMAALHQRFMEEKIVPVMLPRAAALVDSHRRQGHTLLVISATNHFVTRPIVDALGIAELLACEAEIVNGCYTGEPSGIPSYREGKVLRLQAWLALHRLPLEGTWFYSDSHSDLPLLELVDYPVAVDPDPRLAARARNAGWPVISLRD
ncbi:histidinol-phosphatase [Kineobactrum salinum]|uniref:HAD family hydrolase n=1 Tax=Kineobactrum salinum TaxID=2708301 RepID=A0A6C0U3C3_9GAMM|nr:HAD family hydrolase [Kineobactrum salinum]QIB65477.1 HAD family hydrolase [Kineobactrum salinum]